MAGAADPAGLHEQIGFQMTGGDLAGAESSDSPDGAAGDGATPGDTQAAPAPSASESTSTTAASGAAPQDAAQWLDATCPYLRSTDGTWRSVVPQRGQCCWGQQPPAALEPITQERLCRTEAHTRCEIFVAAEQQHLDALARDHVSPERLDGRFGVLVRPSTLVLDEAGSARLPLPPRVPVGRRTRIAVGLGLGGGLVLVVLLAVLGGGGPTPRQTQPPPIAFVSPSPAVATAPAVTSAPLPTQATVAPTSAPLTPGATPAPTSRPTPRPTPVPTVTPGPSHSPGIRTTYRIRKGDTLAGIAAKFGVTKKQLRAVNDFGNPPHLRYGFLINIPYP